MTISIPRILMSAAMIVFVGALVVGGTGAFFSDEETSTGNIFTAGALDLKIDSVQHYNGMVCAETDVDSGQYIWVPEAEATLDDEMHAVVNDDFDQTAIDNFNAANPAQFPQAGVECTGSWRLADDTGSPVIGQFFDFADIKPGDQGENTISIHIDNNDAWMCASLENVSEADNGQTEPEALVDPDDDAAGELDDNLYFFAWLDDGDNIFEPGEEIGTSTVDEFAFGDPILASDLADTTWALADSTTGGVPVAGDETHYIGIYWCAGTIDTNGGAGPLTCDGESMGNEAQTDSWMTDMKFYIEQSRNNPDFECNPEEEPEEPRELVGAVAFAYEPPVDPVATCNLTVDETVDPDTATEFGTLAAAEAAATDGQTICVDTGTYTEDVTVTTPNLTILGLNDPKGGSKATIDGRVDVDVDGVTISGLEFTNPDSSFSIVIDGVNSTEISDNSFLDVGTALSEGSAQAIYYDGAGSPTSGLTLTGNMIDGVGNTSMTSLVGGGSSAKGIFIGDSTGVSTISGVTIENNMIMNIFASTDAFVSGGGGGAGAYGVLLNYGSGSTGSVDGAIIENNDIITLEGLWGHAIGLETDTPSAVVTRNVIADVTDNKGSTDAVGVFFEANPGGDTTVVNENNFGADIAAVAVALHPSNQPAVTVDAENNWWGDATPADEVFEGSGTIDFDPFEVSPFPEN